MIKMLLSFIFMFRNVNLSEININDNFDETKVKKSLPLEFGTQNSG